MLENNDFMQVALVGLMNVEQYIAPMSSLDSLVKIYVPDSLLSGVKNKTSKAIIGTSFTVPVSEGSVTCTRCHGSPCLGSPMPLASNIFPRCCDKVSLVGRSGSFWLSSILSEYGTLQIFQPIF